MQNERDAEGEDELGVMTLTLKPRGFRSADARNQGPVNDIADHEQNRTGEKGGHVRPAQLAKDRLHPKCDKEIIGGIHSDHHEIALGEVDDANYPENQRKTDAHQPVDRADQKSGCKGLQQIFEKLCGHGGGSGWLP